MIMHLVRRKIIIEVPPSFGVKRMLQNMVLLQNAIAFESEAMLQKLVSYNKHPVPLVRRILQYGNVIWSPRLIRNIDAVK